MILELLEKVTFGLYKSPTTILNIEKEKIKVEKQNYLKGLEELEDILSKKKKEVGFYQHRPVRVISLYNTQEVYKFIIQTANLEPIKSFTVASVDLEKVFMYGMAQVRKELEENDIKENRLLDSWEKTSGHRHFNRNSYFDPNKKYT